MYSRLAKAKRQKKRYTILGALLIAASAAGTAFALTKTESAYTVTESQKNIVGAIGSESLVTTASAEEIQETSELEEALDNQDQDTAPAEEEAVPEVISETENAVTEAAPVNTTAVSAPSTSVTNGNTAGAVGSEAAAQMAAATGVPQSTWEYIIARESNGDYTASNTSGASGLFQTMPGWGSTATVQDQINSAINAYNAQGLSAWGY
ncbi:transglycosylase SLT domain-containing protein [Streptococcus sp. H49]|uniref:transglycosylase SLT domain-containing protein n=1 Tax=Streptococcus huangxiaojuni TaxID=3237239 RepID=UPI0034A492B8